MPSTPTDRLVLALALIGALFALATPAAAAPSSLMLAQGLPLVSATPLVLAGFPGLALSIRRGRAG
jgi:hypothetical protein